MLSNSPLTASTEQVGLEVMLWTCNPEVLGLKHGPLIDYPEFFCDFPKSLQANVG
jgi:hypothetical protein